jgi:hypothetical protein
MRSKLLVGSAGIAVAFLLATNPLVAQAAGFITSGDIVNDTIKSKDIKNDGIKGKDVKSSTLDGSDVADSSLTGAELADGSLTGGDMTVRAASASDTSAAVTGTSAVTPALTTSITAPSRGYLMITASSDVFGDEVSSDCWIAVDGVEQVASERVLGNTTGVSEVDCATNVGVVVNAGAHTVQLVADPGSTSVWFDESTLDVIFVPFGSTGAVPARPSPSGTERPNNN